MLRKRERVEDTRRGYGRRGCALEIAGSNSRNNPAGDAATTQETLYETIAVVS